MVISTWNVQIPQLSDMTPLKIRVDQSQNAAPCTSLLSMYYCKRHTSHLYCVWFRRSTFSFTWLMLLRWRMMNSIQVTLGLLQMTWSKPEQFWAITCGIWTVNNRTMGILKKPKPICSTTYVWGGRKQDESFYTTHRMLFFTRHQNQLCSGYWNCCISETSWRWESLLLDNTQDCSKPWFFPPFLPLVLSFSFFLPLFPITTYWDDHVGITGKLEVELVERCTSKYVSFSFPWTMENPRENRKKHRKGGGETHANG